MTSINEYFHEKMADMASVPVDVYHLYLHSYFLGNVCSRRVWLSLHGHYPKRISYQRHRIQSHRERESGFLIEELMKLGLDIHALHPKTKNPIHFIQDGISVRMSAISRVPDTQIEIFPEGWFLVQVEHVKASFLEKICRHGIKDAYPSLWNHCLLGMAFSKLHTCLVYLSADNGVTYAEFLYFNESEYQQLKNVASHFFSDPEPPPRLDVSECGECPQYTTCHSPVHVPAVSCYSCHFHQIRDQAIFCKRYDRLMEEDVWSEGCQEHIFLSGLINFAKKVNETTFENGSVTMTYELKTGIQFTNCGHKTPREGLMFSSREISAGGVLAISSPTVQAVKIHFEGTKIIEP